MRIKAMKGLRTTLIGVISLFLGYSTAQPTSNYGGRGLIHVASAWNLDKGSLTLHGYSRLYFKNVIISPTGSSARFAATYWDAHGSFIIHYASGRHVEWALCQTIYQDNHKGGKGYNLPDDLFLKLKVASFGALNSPFRFGFIVNSRFPTAKYHNLAWEPYSAGTIEMGLVGVASYSSDILIPEAAFNVHVNLGYLNHNDVGKRLAPRDKISVLKPSQEFLYGIGMSYPTTKFDFSLELYGNYMFDRPPHTAFSRENYLYLTPGINFKPYPWFSLIFGFDLNVFSGHETSWSKLFPDMPNYPTWRVNFGAKLYLFSKSKFIFASQKGNPGAGSGDVYEQMAKEKKQVESAEQELEKIRDERRRMEDMLERLRKVLEWKQEENKKKPDEG